MITWANVKITGKDETELARRLDRPKTRIALDIVLAYEREKQMKFERWLRGA